LEKIKAEVKYYMFGPNCDKKEIKPEPDSESHKQQDWTSLPHINN
jgi:hypothetical protein